MKLSPRRAATAAALTLTLAAAAASLTTPAHATAVTTGPVCGLSQRADQQASGGVGVLSRANPFGYAGTYCIRPAAASRPGFTVLDSMPADGAVRAYPFTGTGCAYDLCSHGTDLPKKVGKLGAATSSWTWRGNPAGEWNASYDLWFDRRDQITTQDNGAEVMIWLRTMPGYPPGQVVTIGGRRYEFMAWRAHHDGLSWWYVQFRTLSTTHMVRGLRLWPFLAYAIRRGYVHWGWWLTSVHAGYEIWSGGKGLATTWFNART